MRTQRVGDVVALLAPTVYLGWTVPATWYTGGGGRELGLPIPEFALNAWGGVTAVAGGLAALGVLWSLVRLAGGIRIARGTDRLDPAISTAVLAATLVGLVLPRAAGTGDTRISWGIVVAVALAAAWSAAAWRGFRERRRPRDAVGFTQDRGTVRPAAVGGEKGAA